MEGKVLLTLLGLCMGLAADAQETKLKDFDLVKFSGLWYEIAFASKMGAQSLPYKVEKIAAVVANLEEGQMSLTITYYNEDRCVVEKETALQGDAQGKFKIIKMAGSKEVIILDTDYKTYTIMDISLRIGSSVWRVIKLYSRNLDHNEDILKKFREVAQQQGFAEPDIFLFKHDLTCVKALQSGGVPSS